MTANVLEPSLLNFNYKDHQVRAVIIGNEPWWVAKDVCGVLEIGNPTNAVKRLDQDESALISIKGTNYGNEPLNCVNEPGLYSLVLSSRKPEAKQFKRWITHEVIPSIRKHGTYMTPAKIEEVLFNPDMIIGLATQLKEEQEKRRVLEQQAAENAPKLSYLKRILQSDSSLAITQIAKDYGLSAKKLNLILHAEGIQYRVNNQWVLYSKYQNKNYTRSNTVMFDGKDGNTFVKVTTRWTQAGRLMIHNVLEKRGIVAKIDRQKNVQTELIYASL